MTSGCEALERFDREELLPPRRVCLRIEDAAPSALTAVVRRGGQRPGWPVQGLVLELAAGRAVVAPGQPLDLRARLLNVSDQELIVLRRATHLDLELRVRDPAGRPIAWLEPAVPPPPPTREELVRLLPGAALPLAPWEELVQLNRRVVEGRVRTGWFLIRAAYRTDSGLCEPRRVHRRAWVGAVVANQLLLTVSEEQRPARVEAAASDEVRTVPLRRCGESQPRASEREGLARSGSQPCGVRSLFHSPHPPRLR